MLTKNNFLSSLVLLSSTIACSAQVIITIEAQPDNTGSRISLSGSINSADLDLFAPEVVSAVGVTDNAAFFLEDVFDIPGLDVVGISSPSDIGDNVHASEPNSSASITLINPVSPTTPAIYVSGDLGFSLVHDPNLNNSRIAITSVSNSLGNTALSSYALDLVLDVDNDITEYSNFVFNWDSNGATAGGATINAIVIVPEPSTTALCAIGLTAMVCRRRRR